MADELNIITTDANSVNVTTEDNTVTITNDGDATTVTLSAAETTTVQIATIGPKGDKGDNGSIGNINVTTLATTGSNTFRGTQIISASIADRSALDINMRDDGLWAFRIYNDTYSSSSIGLASWIDNRGIAFLGTETNKPLHIYNNADYYNATLIISSSGVTINNKLIVSGGITGSLLGTASFALTASYSLNTRNTINTSSFATTGSNTFIGNQTITGSLIVQDSVSGSFTGSFNDGIKKLILTGVTDISNSLTYYTAVNTLGDSFTFTAHSGEYTLTMNTTTPFTEGYTYIMFSAGLPVPGGGNVYNTPYAYIDDSTIKFYVKKFDEPYGGVLTHGTIEIRVYN